MAEVNASIEDPPTEGLVLGTAALLASLLLVSAQTPAQEEELMMREETCTGLKFDRRFGSSLLKRLFLVRDLRLFNIKLRK